MRDTVERPHWGWWLSIFVGMGLTTLLALHGGSYALWAEHVTALLPRWLIQLIFVAAWAAHVGEGLYARRVAGELGLSASRAGWTAQTIALGYPSLRLLLARRAGRA